MLVRCSYSEERQWVTVTLHTMFIHRVFSSVRFPFHQQIFLVMIECYQFVVFIIISWKYGNLYVYRSKCKFIYHNSERVVKTQFWEIFSEFHNWINFRILITTPTHIVKTITKENLITYKNQKRMYYLCVLYSNKSIAQST